MTLIFSDFVGPFSIKFALNFRISILKNQEIHVQLEWLSSLNSTSRDASHGITNSLEVKALQELDVIIAPQAQLFETAKDRSVTTELKGYGGGTKG